MQASENRAFDLVIIGGGTAGISAAMEALERGVERVALVERRHQLGGECALTACVPTHTLMKAAKMLEMNRKYAPQYGIRLEGMHLDFTALMRKVQDVIEAGESDMFAQEPRLMRFFDAEASLISRREVRVGETVIRGEKIIIATGSKPTVPRIPGLVEAGFIHYYHATHLKQIPDSLVIIGGGRVGTEFAQIFRAFGSRVTIIEQQERLLPREEPEISEAIAQQLMQNGITLYTGCTVQTVFREDNTKFLQISCPKGHHQLHCREIMVAAGRTGQTKGLDLEAIGIQISEEGIVVNDFLQTTVESIYAIGDVVGPYRYTHVADYHAVIAVQNAMMNAQKPVQYHAVPWIVFTEPNIAHVGLTQAEAESRYPSTLVLKTPASEPSRFRIESMTEGFIKIIVDVETDRIIGAHILADQAGEMIHLLALAMQSRLPISEMTEMVYAYPTRSQLIQKVLEPYPREKAKMISAGQAVLQSGG